MSTLRTNALEGVDAKNSITIVAGAGNVTTTNVQEGLCKAWVNFNGTGTIATRDSFNVSGLTDNAQGDYTSAFTSNFNNSDYSLIATTSGDSGNYGYLVPVGPESDNEFTPATSSIRAGAAYASDTSSSRAKRDPHQYYKALHGDLA